MFRRPRRNLQHFSFTSLFSKPKELPVEEISCSYSFEFAADDEDSDYSLAESLSESTDRKFGIDEVTKVVILKVTFNTHLYFSI
jgi:hypothetical protein